MKTTIVPAQITSIEDIIVGSLSVTQVLLLSMPLFFAVACYIGLPPFAHFAAYKTYFMVCAVVLGFCLALRVRGQLVLYWLILVARYNLRPRYYLHRKTTDPIAHRVVESDLSHKSGGAHAPTISSRVRGFKLIESSVLQKLRDNPSAQLTFRSNKRGGTDVLYSEVER